MMNLYNVHDLIKVESDTDVPIPSHFKVEEESSAPDLRVINEDLDFSAPEECEVYKGNYRFWREGNLLLIDYGMLGAKLALNLDEVRYSSILRKFCSKDVWDSMILAMVSTKLIRRNYALIHSGAVAHGDEGILILALQDVGKTSTVLTLVEEPENKLMGDDMAIIGEGKLLSFPRDVRISPRTLAGPFEAKRTFKDKIFRSRYLSTLFERFRILPIDITKHIKVPESLIKDKCPVKKVFIILGYGKGDARRIDEEKALTLASNLSISMPNFLGTYLDMYYHLFNIDVAGIIDNRIKIMRKCWEESKPEFYEVEAPSLKGFAEAIRGAL